MDATKIVSCHPEVINGEIVFASNKNAGICGARAVP